MLGEIINNYEIKSLLGEGGMGAVYLAEHPFIGRKAAIKVLRRELAQDASLVERFMNEARAANAIRHPNIIDIIDVGRTPSGVPYLMMEFLDGVSLAQRIAQVGQLDVAEALEIGVQTAGALAAAHAKAIVHRDLKPDNLFLVPDDARPGGAKVKVLDFGIAKLRGELSSSSRTQAGALMGTPPYMSPEQCRGLSDEIDHRTDIYALGIILYEMLCGAPPFVSQGWGEIVLAHLTKPPPPARDKNPRIPATIEAAIQKALAKERDARFATMVDLRADLQAALRAGSQAGAHAAAAPALSTRPPAAGLAGDTVMAAPAPTTTFRNAAAEVTPAAGISAARRRPGLWLVAGGVAAAAVAAVVIAKGRSGYVATDVSLPAATGSQSAPAGAPPPTASAPAPPPATAPAPSSAAPHEAPPPAAEPPVAAQIRLRLASEPAGASVVDARDGAVLGSTPLDRRVDRAQAPRLVRISKAGFASAEISIPGGADFETAVRLERARTRPSSTTHRPPAAATPAKSPPPAATVVAPPSPPRPATPEPPAPAPRRAEKW